MIDSCFMSELTLFYASVLLYLGLLNGGTGNCGVRVLLQG